MTVPGPADGHDCPDAAYWRDEALAARAAVDQPAPDGDLPRYLLPEPPMPGDLLAYEDGPEPVSVGDRVMGLLVLGPWLGSVWAWSVGVVAHELVKAVRGR